MKQWVCPVDKKRKSAVLTKLIHNNDWGQVLVFTRTKHGANRLTKELEAAHIMATAIHGNKSQGARTRALAEFKQGQVQVLVATDIAARGLDIDQLPHVVNFDLPNVAADYVHRIGRTARAGAEGEAVSLVCVDEFDELADIERLINQILPRETMDGFEPLHVLPVSSLTSRPPRKPKPKKPNKGRKMGGNNQRRDASAAPKKKRPARKPGNRGGSAGAAGAKAGGGARRK